VLHPGFDAAARAGLVVVLAAEARVESTLKYLQEGVGCLTLPDSHLDIRPLPPNSNLLPAIRKARCSFKPASNAGSEIQSQPRRWCKSGENPADRT